MTGGWAATNTLRDARDFVPDWYDAPLPYRDEFDAALALVETALAAAENYVEHAYPSLLRGKRDPNHPLLSALAAALRALREGAS